MAAARTRWRARRQVRPRVLAPMLAPMLAVAATAGGCGTGGAPERLAPPPDMSVELHQFRADRAVHQLLVGVRNSGPHPVYVRDVQLVSGSFRTVPATRVDDELPPTPRVDLPIPYGAARCDATTIPEVRPAAVLARIRRAGERTRRVRFPIAHPDPLLRQLLASECGTYILRQSMDVRLGAAWTATTAAGEDVLRGTLVLRRTGRPRPVTITALGGSPQYELQLADRTLPFVVPAGTGELVLRADISPARCDPHGLSEAKYSHLYAVFAKVGAGGPYKLPFAATGQVRAGIDAFARTACGRRS